MDINSWEDEGWFLGKSDFYVFYFHDPSSPIFSNIDKEWTSNSTLEEDFVIAVRAPYLELTTYIDMVIIMIYENHTYNNPIRKLDLLDHTFSFLWKAAP